MTETFAILHQIEKNGWSVAPRHGGWRLDHPLVDGPIYVSNSQTWLCFTSPIATTESVERHEQLNELGSLNRHRLAQNEFMYMAKYGLDTEGSPFLTVEAPIHTVSQSMLRVALEAISREKAEITDLMRDKEEIDSDSQNQIVKIVQANNSLEPIIPKEIVVRYMRSLGSSGWFTKEIKTEQRGLTWILGYKGRYRKFDVYFMLTRNWAYFQVPVLADRIAPVLSSGDTHARAYFMEYLLRLNGILFMAKLGLDAKDQVLLLLEMPAESLTLRLLQLMARTIATYLNRYGQEIQIMASLQNDPKLIELLYTAVE